METLAQGPRRGGILPAPAWDLLDRLTAELAIPFTLTDSHGAVVASTGGCRVGQVDDRAAHVLEAGDPLEVLGPSTQGASEAAVYTPLVLSGRAAGVLIAHGDPEVVRMPARISAVAIGLALDFATAASLLGKENVNPGWLLYRLLRGSRVEAQQARVIAAIFGWNLFVQRVAIVVMSGGPGMAVQASLHPRDADGVVRRLLGASATTTPFGQMDETEWVIFVQHEPREPWSRVREIAQQFKAEFSASGGPVNVGIGEPHLPVSPILALRRSYREAMYATRVGPRLDGRLGIYELRTLGPAAFFAPSSPSRRNIAALVLEPLREHPATLDTRIYLARNLSVAATAAELGLHRHTVRNHLERVFHTTGFDLRSLDGAVQLKLALLVMASNPSPGDPFMKESRQRFPRNSRLP